MIAITCALQSTEVSRLEYSIAEVPAPKRTLLEEMGDISLPHGNHRNYRNVLQAMTRQRADDYCIPWLGTSQIFANLVRPAHITPFLQLSTSKISAADWERNHQLSVRKKVKV